MKTEQDPKHDDDLLSQVNSQPLIKNEIRDYTQQTLLDVNSQPIIHTLTGPHLAHPILGETTAANMRPPNPSEELLHPATTTTTTTASTTTTTTINTGSMDTANNNNNSATANVATSPRSVLKAQAESSSGTPLKGTQGSSPPPMTETEHDTEPSSPPVAPTIPMDPSNPILSEFYERFSVGRMFDSLEDLRTEAYEYGRKHNVALTTSKSDKTKIYLICKHGGQYRRNTKRPPPGTVKPRIRKSQKTGCACMIYARHCKGSFWVVRKSIGEHNHQINNDESAYAMYRTLTPEQLLEVHRLLRDHTSVSDIVKDLKGKGANNILAKDIENIQQELKRKEVMDLPSSEHQAIISTALTGSPSSEVNLTTVTHNTIDHTHPH